MYSIYHQPVFRISFFAIVLLVVFLGYHTAFSQATPIFRSVGLDLNVDPLAVSTDGGGMVDINNDGWLDLFPGVNILLNNGVTNGLLQPFTLDTSAAIGAECRFADFNNDGLMDGYATTQINGSDLLFFNQGNGKFVEIGDSMGISYPATKFTLACALADFDNDSWVDILVGSHLVEGVGSGMWLWRNEGGKRFVNVADQMQVNIRSGWLGAVWADYDNDGDQDFFVAGARNGDVLFRNDGNTFTNVTNITKMSAMGAGGHSRSGTWGDYNNDGRLDLYNCDDEKMNRLYRNDGDNVVWPDVAKELHVANRDAGGWALDKDVTADWGDYDNDGDLDLVTTSQGGEFNAVSENRLYRNDGAAGFVEIGQGTELADQGQQHFNAAFGDVDQDGDLDLYIVVGPSKIPPALGGGMDLLFENLIGNNNNWLQFRLTGVQCNRSAIGTRIRCVSAAHPLQIREVHSGHGYNCSSPLTQHFGFGQDTAVDSVIIRWPSGTVDRFVHVAVNQILNISEGSTTGVVSKVAMPEQLRLKGNYPNPFNPQTTIQLSLPKLETVTVRVLDILGREVRKLIDHRLLSGEQEVRWDGRDNLHNPVASGIYLCQLTANGSSMTHWMTLLK